VVGSDATWLAALRVTLAPLAPGDEAAAAAGEQVGSRLYDA
jgi:hypothetical protein